MVDSEGQSTKKIDKIYFNVFTSRIFLLFFECAIIEYKEIKLLLIHSQFDWNKTCAEVTSCKRKYGSFSVRERRTVCRLSSLPHACFSRYHRLQNPDDCAYTDSV